MGFKVFLSFDGLRYGFALGLYYSLIRKKITAITENSEIETLLYDNLFETVETVETVDMCIIVFSESYAMSGFLPQLLVKIMEWKDTNKTMVIPVFYGVDPSQVRRQTGHFGEAFEAMGKRFPENSQKWRNAMRRAADLSGFVKGNFITELEFIEEITTMVVKIAEKSLLGPEYRISEVSSLLDISSSDEVIMVGIYGSGGMGKTTIARGIYDSLGHHFEAKCFVSNVGENSSRGLMHLQNIILSEMLGDFELNIRTANHGMSLIRHGLCNKKILLVLDDVDELEQLEALAGGSNWFGIGSRIIITTRVRHLLAHHGLSGDKIWEARGLNDREALKLFSVAAFRSSEPDPTHVNISKRIVQCSKGVPLILKIIGSSFSESRIDEWEFALGEYEKLPKKRVHDMLKISYDSLQDTEKEMFLDIACFFKGEDLGYTINVLDAFGLKPRTPILKLIDMSLITIEENRICMHDLIQEMGRKIVQQESPLEPGKRSRLYDPKDVLHVLSRDLGSDKIQGILFDGHQEVKWRGDTFRKMKNLRILIIRGRGVFGAPTYLPSSLEVLDWMDYPLASLPKDFDGRNLVVLKLIGSAITKCLPLMIHKNLTFVNVSNCDIIEEIPDVSGAPNLSKLHARYCQNLKKVHDSVGFLKELTEISVLGSAISHFPSILMSKFLEAVDISLNYEIDRFPDVRGEMRCIISVAMGYTSIQELPKSFGNLSRLETLVLRSCKLLRIIPWSFFALQNLKELDMEDCPQVSEALRFHTSPFLLLSLVKLNMSECDLTEEDIPVLLHHFPRLESLLISRNNLLFSLPICFQNFVRLESLDIASCTNLKIIEALPLYLRTIVASDCKSLSEQSSNLLLFQGVSTETNLKVIVPGEKIPEWFKHYKEGGTICFWFCQGFPMCALCLVIEPVRYDFELQFILSINGSEVLQRCSPFRNMEPMSHVFLYDLHAALTFQQEHIDESIRQHEWNHVEISCLVRYNFCKDLDKPKWCAIHVYECQNVKFDH